MRNQPGVFDAIVVAIAEPGDITTLHGVYTGSDAAAEGLIDTLGTLLPAHMLPRTIVHWSELPLNPNGKVDRTAVVTQLRSR
jgi:acyl-coenzyme A synthetase/AMP-(fatty) acid ligase